MVSSSERAPLGAAGIALVFLAAGGSSACGSSAVPEPSAGGPAWVRLAAGRAHSDPAPLLVEWSQRGPLAYRFDENGPDGGGATGAWASLALEPSLWRFDGARWRHPLPPELRFEPGDRGELALAERVLPIPPRGRQLPRATLTDEELVLWIGEEVEDGGAVEGELPDPPTGARLALWVERGPIGHCAENQAALSTIEEGLVVWPGERVELTVDVPARSALAFQPRTRAFTTGTSVTHRVRLGERVLFEHTSTASEPARPAPVVIPLGEAAIPAARFVFEVEGTPAATAFAQPVLRPAELGVPGSRPWPASKGDVVIFLADTCRADLLAAYGGDPGLMPELNALAERSVRFLEAHSPATWTLPAHASLFTGTWPPQHGGELRQRGFAAELETLAELYARSGYRTAALTDGLYLSRAYGFQRGFQWFQVQRDAGKPRLGASLASARALIDADDGRPLFLFVQSYRLHWPYRSGPEEDSRAARAMRKETARLAREIADPEEARQRMAPLIAALHERYREGARALDAAVGPFVAELEGRGLFRAGLFVFTSDHGEEFREHGALAHGGIPHEVQVRVPLFLFGAGETARDVRAGASLVDLAPTLAAHGGLERSPRWVGRDLLAEDSGPERLLFSCVLRGAERHVGVWEGARKLLATGAAPLPDGVSAAYALDADPQEQTDVRTSAAWPRELADAARASWEAMSVPLGSAPEVELDEEQMDELRRLGYGD